MQCPKCFTSNPESSDKCLNCGQQLITEPSKAQPNPAPSQPTRVETMSDSNTPTSRNKKVLMIFILLALIIIVLAFAQTFKSFFTGTRGINSINESSSLDSNKYPDKNYFVNPELNTNSITLPETFSQQHAYPGWNLKYVFDDAGENKDTTMIGAETSDSLEKVGAFYRDLLTDEGWVLKFQSETEGIGLGFEKETQTMGVFIKKQGQNTYITLQYYPVSPF